MTDEALEVNGSLAPSGVEVMSAGGFPAYRGRFPGKGEQAVRKAADVRI